MGPAMARLLYILVRFGFLLSIITIFPMQVGTAVLIVGMQAAGQCGSGDGPGGPDCTATVLPAHHMCTVAAAQRTLPLCLLLSPAPPLHGSRWRLTARASPACWPAPS